MTIRFGVIGAGRIGKAHALSIVRNPKALMACVADAQPQAAQALAERQGAKVASVGRIMEATGGDAVLHGDDSLQAQLLADAVTGSWKTGKPARISR